MLPAASPSWRAAGLLQPSEPKRASMARSSSVSHAVLIARSLLFNAVFYLNLLLHMLVAIPTFVLPDWFMVQIARSWGRTTLWLLRAICGIRVEWHGREKIPKGAF